MPITVFDEAASFLTVKRLALVGLERAPNAFSRVIFREFVRRGYDVVPVSPLLGGEAEGRPAFARLQDVQPPVEAALIMTPPAHTAEVVRDAIAAGVTRIWLHRGSGAGSASPEALELCRAHHLRTVTDLCPYMALPGAGFGHRVHTFFRARALAKESAERHQLKTSL